MSYDELLTITTDQTAIDEDLVVFEIQDSYWAKNRPREAILKSIDNSLCFSVFLNNQQVGFTRVVSDYSTFAYLCDVFIVRSHQNNGLGKMLLKAVLGHQDLKSVKWLLRTKDAHGLYENFGFIKTERPERYMEKNGVT